MLWDLLENDLYAWEVLRNPEASGNLNAEGILEFYRAAGYPEEVAQKRATQRANARLDQDLPP